MYKKGKILGDVVKQKDCIPGHIATGLLCLATSLWTYWGFGEMFYEGWWGAWTNRLPYLVPTFICWIFAFLALTWPRLGGWIILAIGGGFTAWRWILQARLGGLSFAWVLGWIPISLIFVLIGGLFILEGIYRRKRHSTSWLPPRQWWRRNLRYLVVYIPSLLTAAGVTALFAPLIASRFDDNRHHDVRTIAGNGVALIWAPAGPGWSAGVGPSQQAGELLPDANLSWNEIAFYGLPPVGFGDKPGFGDRDATTLDMQTTGLCRYLSADGRTLRTAPQDIWRMPTVDEIVRSLVRAGENAGCSWDGHSSSADCDRQPNKDTPLWDPDASPIYYYSGEEYDESSAWYVPYTGGGMYGGVIGAQSKSGGNSRHGFRCVREP